MTYRTALQNLWCIPMFLMLAGLVTAQETDVMELENGASRSGTLQGYTVQHYLFQTDQQTRKIRHERVHNVRFWDITKELGRMERAFQNLRYERAISFGQQVRSQIDQGDLREVHAPRVLYILATSHFRLGQLESAIKRAKEGLSSPAHVWFDPLVRIRILARAYQLYDPDKPVTDRSLEAISSLGKRMISLARNQAKAPESVVDYVRYLRLQAMEELGEGKLSIVRVRYENMDKLSLPELNKRVFLGSQRCLIRQHQKLQNVVQSIDKKLENNAQDPLMQSVRGLAQSVLRMQGWKEESDDLALLRDAISPVIDAQLIHDSSTELHTIQHRQTLFQTLMLYQTIANNSSKKKQTSYFAEQAKHVRDELLSLYPGSPEAQKADTIIERQ